YITCNSPPEGEAITHEIHLVSNDIEALLVDFLSELLFLFEIKNFVPMEFNFAHIDDESLEVICIGTVVSNLVCSTEIKGVTHHLLNVENTANGWEAKIYFDL
ncbi:MAG: archease, partial [bacterium]